MKKQFESVVERDPLRLKKYDIDVRGHRSFRLLYIILALIPILLIAALALYAIGTKTDLDEVPVGAIKLQEVENGSTTVGEEEDDELRNTTLIPIKGEVYSNRNKVPDSFDKIKVGMRIMPSQNDEMGIIRMKSSNEANE
jgi:hypothetical protein